MNVFRYKKNGRNNWDIVLLQYPNHEVPIATGVSELQAEQRRKMNQPRPKLRPIKKRK